MNTIKSVKTSVDDSLKKVRSKKWSKPLGKTLDITGQIVTGKVIIKKSRRETFLLNRK